MPSARSFPRRRNAGTTRYISPQIAAQREKDVFLSVALSPSPGPVRSLLLRGSKNEVDSNFRIDVDALPRHLFEKDDELGILRLGEYTLLCINVDIDAMIYGYPDWDIQVDIANLSQILPYVQDWVEEKRINARLNELKAAVCDKSFEARRQEAIKARLEDDLREEERRQDTIIMTGRVSGSVAHE